MHFPPTIFKSSVKMQAILAGSALTYRFEPSLAQWQAIDRSAKQLEHHLSSSKLIYGIHTHFGFDVERRHEGESFSEHQLELLRYLQVGTGASLSPSVVRRALWLQVKKSCFGVSGLQSATLRALIQLASQEEMPIVPRHGSLGASGDLVPMAHAIANLFNDQLKPGPRDVLSLVNTNAMMASHAAELWQELFLLWQRSIEISTLIWAATGSSWQPLEILTRSPIAEQRVDESTLATLILDRLKLQNSLITSSNRTLQPRYSLRCLPQILALQYQQLRHAESWIIQEADAVSDNPLIFEDQVCHGGLFYASYLAAAADAMQDVIGHLGESLDRQVLLLMDPTLSGGLPPNLEAPHLSHCKGLHQLISALCQRLRALAMPCRMMSFSCESNNQDLVPCAMEGLNLVGDQLSALKDLVLAAEFCAKRAWDLRQGLSPDPLELWRHPNR